MRMDLVRNAYVEPIQVDYDYVFGMRYTGATGVRGFRYSTLINRRAFVNNLRILCMVYIFVCIHFLSLKIKYRR